MLHRPWKLLLLIAWAAPASAADPPLQSPAEPAPDSLQILDLEKSRGVPWLLPPSDEAWLRPLHVTPSLPPRRPPEDEFAAIDALFDQPDESDQQDVAAPLHSATAPTSDVPMRPHLYVHPQVPAKVIAKRRVHDSVRLQVLVGPDGSVADVRVVRGIPSCRECVESAVLAAKQFVYDAPDPTTLPFGVWTLPFEFEFSYRR